MNRQFLESQIAGIVAKRNECEWLTGHLTQAERLANFGCHNGLETLALMWLLDAREAVGLDIDADRIRQARDTLDYLQEEVQLAWQAFQYELLRMSDQDRRWWSSLPDFFTQRILDNSFSLEYHTRDVTKPTELPDNHFDLAFCDRVLHHIWYDSGPELGKQNAQFTITEMARIVKPGGIVSASELIQFNDKPRLDFTELFGDEELEELYVYEEDFEDLERTDGKYVYRKRA